MYIGGAAVALALLWGAVCSAWQVDELREANLQAEFELQQQRVQHTKQVSSKPKIFSSLDERQRN